MSEIVSTQGMLKRLEGLLDTGDLSDWERGFVRSLRQQLLHKRELSEKQHARLTEIFTKHFAG